MDDPKNYLYGRKGPWPQPCPDHPYGESPGVIHLPWQEWIDWWLRIGLRFVIQWPLFTPIYYLMGLMNPGCKPVSDQEFHRFLTDSMMARFITPKLDPHDYEAFKDCMEAGKSYFVVDLEPVRVVKPFKGIFVSPTKTLLEEEQSGEFKVRCIWIQETATVLTPQDGDAWELAKYFVLQGGALCATMVVHPLQHFPLDSINAITKTALPKDHVLFKLLHPHLRFTLPLENAVLNFKMSLLHDDRWWKTYAPFPGEYKGIRKLLVEGYTGIHNNDSYPAFSYPRRPPRIYSGYGVFLDSYYGAIFRFVSQVVADIPKDDTHVKNWANYIKSWVPGFPDGNEIFEGCTLAEVVAYFIWDVTVGHTIDHHNYKTMDVQQVPLRIRQAPPKKDTKMVSRKKLQSPIDLMKYRLAMRLFFGPSVLTRLIDVKYGFKDDKLQLAVERFKTDLRQTERSLEKQGLKYLALDEIANSIQF